MAVMQNDIANALIVEYSMPDDNQKTQLRMLNLDAEMSSYPFLGVARFGRGNMHMWIPVACAQAARRTEFWNTAGNSTYVEASSSEWSVKISNEEIELLAAWPDDDGQMHPVTFICSHSVNSAVEQRERAEARIPEQDLPQVLVGVLDPSSRDVKTVVRVTLSSDRFWKAAAIHQHTPKHEASASSGAQAPNERPPFTYTWFGGTPEEDVRSFIHSVQRTALAQNRQGDDAWIVQYVEKCLSGSALLWFSSLEGESKRTWAPLREAFIQRFAPSPRADGVAETQPSPANPFGALLLSPKPSKVATVQVIDTFDHAILGYLSKALTFAVEPFTDHALLVECPPNQSATSQEPTYLRIINQDPRSTPAFLGLTGGGTDEEPKPWLLTPCSSASLRTSSIVLSTGLSLPSATLVWQATKDGELNLMWPKDDGKYTPVVIGRDQSATASIVLENPNQVIDKALFKERGMDVLIVVTETQLASTFPGFKRVRLQLYPVGSLGP
ncbi:hypothetical protein FRC01_000357 [Tulasnella sp. 417]|nr:hypothetical protein FRC01_000357 [Tulasnella sp. 417]